MVRLWAAIFVVVLWCAVKKSDGSINPNKTNKDATVVDIDLLLVEKYISVTTFDPIISTDQYDGNRLYCGTVENRHVGKFTAYDYTVLLGMLVISLGIGKN